MELSCLAQCEPAHTRLFFLKLTDSTQVPMAVWLRVCRSCTPAEPEKARSDWRCAPLRARQ